MQLPDTITGCPYNIASCKGCTDLRHAQPIQQEVEKQRQLFFDMIMSTDTLQMIQSPTINREQLFVCLTNNLVWLQQMPERYNLLRRLRDWFEPRSDIMATAMDCLLLTNFARVTNNSHFLMHAEKLHASAVFSLTRRLQKAGAADSDSVLAATDALGVCQLYRGQPRMQHAHAMGEILRTRGFNSIKCASGLTRTLIFNAVHICIAHGLTSRTPIFFGEQQWQRKLKAACAGKVWCLFHMTCRLPALLKRVNTVRSISLWDAAGLLNELLKLESQMQNWLLAWYKEEATIHFELTSINTFPDFVNQCGAVAAEVFPEVYTYKGGLLAALGHLTYWTMLLPLREAIFDVAIEPQLTFLTTRRYHEFRMRAVNECAESICRTAPFLMTQAGPTQLSAGERSVFGAILVTLKWFEKIGHKDKVGYCRSVLHLQRRLPSGSDSSLESIQWVDVDGYLMRRLLWQDIIGPSKCVEKKGQGS